MLCKTLLMAVSYALGRASGSRSVENIGDVFRGNQPVQVFAGKSIQIASDAITGNRTGSQFVSEIQLMSGADYCARAKFIDHVTEDGVGKALVEGGVTTAALRIAKVQTMDS